MNTTDIVKDYLLPVLAVLIPVIITIVISIYGYASKKRDELRAIILKQKKEVNKIIEKAKYANNKFEKAPEIIKKKFIKQKHITRTTAQTIGDMAAFYSEVTDGLGYLIKTAEGKLKFLDEIYDVYITKRKFLLPNELEKIIEEMDYDFSKIAHMNIDKIGEFGGSVDRVTETALSLIEIDKSLIEIREGKTPKEWTKERLEIEEMLEETKKMLEEINKKLELEEQKEKLEQEEQKSLLLKPINEE